ncbi:unnamed protein product [Camellia sinensis]
MFEESDLVELETTVEPAWPKLVEPLEKILDRLWIVWGIVNHLNAIKDSPELRSAITEVQPKKVEFQLRVGQSKPIYNAFKTIRESSDWETLSDARKQVVEGADVCHAYQLLKKGGLKDENIIVFMYDDMAQNEENPRPRIIINSPHGDYTGENVTVNNFFSVTLGHKTALTGEVERLWIVVQMTIFSYFTVSMGPLGA